FFSSRRRHTRFSRDWSSDVCSSDLVVPLAVGAAILLLYIIFRPLIHKKDKHEKLVPHIDEIIVNDENGVKEYKNIALALDFSRTDTRAISSALQMGGRDAEYTLIHIVETVGAMMYGD